MRSALWSVFERRTVIGSMCALLAMAAAGQMAVADTAVLSGSGNIVLMRHAEAPGYGDPPGFKLGDCSTQRNLDEGGRAQSRRIGAVIAASGIAFSKVMTSRWCRATETAQIVTGREPTPLPALDSFFDNRAEGPRQLAELRTWIGSLAPDENVLLVTHQVVISGLIGVSPASGEMVVVRRGGDGKLEVKGRVPTR